MFIQSFHRKSLLILCLVIAIAADSSSQTQRHSKEPTPEQRRPFFELAKRNLSDRNGRVRMDLWAAGMDRVERMERSNFTLPSPNQSAPGAVNFLRVTNSIAPQVPGNTWYPQGPAPLRNIHFEGTVDSGEVVSIAIDPRGESTAVIYIATGFGGIWKTTNGGGLWQPTTDHMPSLQTGAVALDVANPDIVYAGTGNPYQSTYDPFNFDRIKAIGIYRSPDGGNRWEIKGREIFGPRGTRPGFGIYKILSPWPNAILVATNNGLYYSPNGGNTFGSNIPRFDNSQPVLNGDIRDLAVDTSQSNIIYATVSGQGILRSLNYGLTFPLNLFKFSSGVVKPGTPAAGNFGPLWFGQSRYPNNRTMYASVADAGTGYAGLFNSTDGGGTWVRFSDLDGVRKQVPYDLTVGVHPTIPSRVYVGFVDLWRSITGGRTFQIVGDQVVHADHHAIAFSPPSHYAPRRLNPIVFVGSDGGIYSSADAGNTWRVDLNETISSNLIVGFAMAKSDPRYMYAGIWDQGIASRGPSDTGTSWRRGDFGDGANVAIDPLDPTVCYHSSGMMGPAFIRTTNGGASWQGVEGLNWVPDRLFFVPKRTGGIITSSELYAALGNALYRINTDSHRGPVTATLIATFAAVVNMLVYSDSQPEMVWASTMAGEVLRTDNINAPTTVWVNKGSPGGGRPATVGAHPRNPEQACVVYTGFSDAGPGQPTQHVYCTQNGGTNWTDVGGRTSSYASIPDLPVYDVVLVDDPRFPRLPPKVIVATEAGVMINDGNLTSPLWNLLGWGLPKSTCSRLQYVPRLNALAVSLWGRGVFRFGSPR